MTRDGIVVAEGEAPEWRRGSVDSAFADGFLETAVEVLRSFGLSAEVLAETPSIQIPGPVERRAIGVLVRVQGDMHSMTWQFPVSVTEHAAHVFAPGIALDGEVLEACASELANILTGRGLHTLAPNVNGDLEPPEITMLATAGLRGQLTTQLGDILVIFHRASDA